MDKDSHLKILLLKMIEKYIDEPKAVLCILHCGLLLLLTLINANTCSNEIRRTLSLMQYSKHTHTQAIYDSLNNNEAYSI